MKIFIFLFINIFLTITSQPINTLTSNIITQVFINSTINNFNYSINPETNKLAKAEYILGSTKKEVKVISEYEFTLNDSYGQDMKFEAFGILINNLTITDYITTNRLNDSQYVINSFIDPSVRPDKYFKSINKTNDTTNLSFSCNYNNPGPLVEYDNENDNDIYNLEHLVNKNFALKKNTSGIFVVKMNSFSFKIESVDKYMIGNYTTANKTYIKFFVLNQFYQTDYILAAFTNDNNIDLFNVTDNESVFQLESWTTIYIGNEINTAAISPADITGVGYIDNKIYVSLNNINGGLFGYLNNNGTFSNIVKVTNTELNYIQSSNVTNTISITEFRIIDMLINNHTAYLIVKNYGMFIYDISNDKLANFYHNNTNLVKFDYMTYGNTYYVGLYINSAANSEFLIEFLLIDEFNPVINRIYISDVPITHGTHCVSDNYSSLTYIYLQNYNKLIAVTRAVASYSDVFNYVIDTNNNLAKYNLTKDNSMIQMVMSEDDDTKTHSFSLHSNNQFVFIGHFDYPSNTLNCTFNKPAEYKFSFTSGKECSDKSANNACKIDYVFNAFVYDSEENKSGHGVIWIPLIIAAVLAIFVILYVLCCRKKHANSQLKGDYMKQSGREVEIVEMDQKF